MEKRKIFRTLIGMVLALVITFAAVPQTAHAADYSSDKINTSAQAGKTYTIKTYFPGIGFQKVKVKFETVTKEDGYLYGNRAYPAKKAQVTIKCSIPKATQNKIKNNVVKIYKASKFHNENNSRLFTSLMDANTGFAFNNSNLEGKLYLASSKPIDSHSKVFRQTAAGWRVNYTLQTDATISYEIVYPRENEGNILVGIAGVCKDVNSSSTKVTNFMTGNAPITNSVLYKKKMKNLSIWTRL